MTVAATGQKYGSLVLNTGLSAISRTIAPTSDLKSLVDSYSLAFSDHSGEEADFSVPYIEGSKITDIPIGTWELNITGIDSDGNAICTGTPDNGNPVTITDGENSISVVLSPIIDAGSGILDYSIEFPGRGRGQCYRRDRSMAHRGVMMTMNLPMEPITTVILQQSESFQ